MSTRKATPKEREAIQARQPKRVLHVTGRTCGHRKMINAKDLNQEPTS